MSAIPFEEAGARLTIDLSALQQNYRDLAAMAPKAECAAVVKADAYGLGIQACGPALFEAGARTFFVAQISEARNLLAALPQAVVYVLSGFIPGTAAVFAEIGARPILSSKSEVEEWSAFCASSENTPPAALHVDTGINRLGVSMEDARKFAGPASSLANIDIAMVMSHLACSDNPTDEMNALQHGLFGEIAALFPKAKKSLANSAAILKPNPAFGDFQFDIVRPGIALYGLRAVNNMDNPMQTVATLEARVMQIRNIKAGDHVGYGATFRAEKDQRVAILSLGYADGYFRSLGAPTGEERAFCAIDGQRVPVIGRVSMDMIAIDVTMLDQDEVSRGSLVEVMGPTISADELADLAGTIGYEILNPLGQRFNRVYVKDGIEWNQ